MEDHQSTRTQRLALTPDQTALVLPRRLAIQATLQAMLSMTPFSMTLSMTKSSTPPTFRYQQVIRALTTLTTGASPMAINLICHVPKRCRNERFTSHLLLPWTLGTSLSQRPVKQVVREDLDLFGTRITPFTTPRRGLMVMLQATQDRPEEWSRMILVAVATAVLYHLDLRWETNQVRKSPKEL